MANEKTGFSCSELSLESQKNSELRQYFLLNQHLKMSRIFYDQRLSTLKESEERHSMQCEDSFGKLFDLCTFNKSLEEKQGKIDLKYISELQEKSERNEIKMQKYTFLLNELGDY